MTRRAARDSCRSMATASSSGSRMGFTASIRAAAASRCSHRVDADRPGNRINDGRARRGRPAVVRQPWTMARKPPPGASIAWMPTVPTAVESGICITNGPCSSPRRQGVLPHRHAEEGNLRLRPRQRRHAFEQAPLCGDRGGRRLSRWLDRRCRRLSLGRSFRGLGARRYAPSGKLVSTVRFPCANITKLAFAGPTTVYATTAWKGLDEAARAEQPLAAGCSASRSDAAG